MQGNHHAGIASEKGSLSWYSMVGKCHAPGKAERHRRSQSLEIGVNESFKSSVDIIVEIHTNDP